MAAIDFNNPEFLAHPYPIYRQLRHTTPVLNLMPGLWLVTRHAEADRILRDPRMVKGYLPGVARRYGPDAIQEPVFQIVNRFMLVMNPPEHTRLRALVGKAFSVKQAPELRRLAQREAETLAAGLVGRGRADLVAEFAQPLPIRVICALLDIQMDDSREFQQATQDFVKVFELAPLSRADLDAANRAIMRMQDYFREICRERRLAPGQDLISRLLQAEEGDQKLSEEEIIANIILLFGAGHETTANMLGNTLLALFQHPEQLAQVRADFGLLPQTVEEALRYESTVQMAVRTTLDDIELGGMSIHAGDTVYVSLGAANRDPEVFADPDTFNIHRDDSAKNPLPFGGGAHYCLGARLAKIELETALETLFRHMPGLRLVNVDKPRWKPTLAIRGLDKLEAVW